jgi:hypothetical protein
MLHWENKSKKTMNPSSLAVISPSLIHKKGEIGAILFQTLELWESVQHLRNFLGRSDLLEKVPPHIDHCNVQNND